MTEEPTYAQPLPDLTNELSRPYWTAAREGRLAIQCCEACGYFRFPPAPICPECWSPDSRWTPVSGTGTLWSFATYHRALSPAFSGATPYTVAWVVLDEGPTVVGAVTTDEGTFGAVAELQVGDRMRAVFDAVTPEVTLVRFRRDPAG